MQLSENQRPNANNVQKNFKIPDALNCHNKIKITLENCPNRKTKLIEKKNIKKSTKPKKKGVK